jgi:hypothetical protein
MSEPPIVLRIDGKLTPEDLEEMKQRLSEALSERRPPVILPPREEWVLVKGWHDSGTIDGVYGPYTEERARWLMGGMLEYASANWTLAGVQSGPPE